MTIIRYSDWKVKDVAGCYKAGSYRKLNRPEMLKLRQSQDWMGLDSSYCL